MNKNFKQLYDFCQRLPCPPSISRKIITDKAQDVARQRVAIYPHGLDTQIFRGLFLSGFDGGGFVKQNGGDPVILVARDMSDEWRRLVEVKEVMHLFDEPHELTSNAADFEVLINSLATPTPGHVPAQVDSEYLAVFMALACFCPETTRKQFMLDVERGHTDEYEIALKLRLPQQFVRTLLTKDFVTVVESIWQ